MVTKWHEIPTVFESPSKNRGQASLQVHSALPLSLARGPTSMAPRLGTCLMLLLTGACVAPRPEEAPPPPKAPLLREAIAVLSTQALSGERVDWQAVLARLESDLPQTPSIEDERAAIHAAVALLGDAHARYFEPPPVATSPPSALPESTPPAPAPAPVVPTLPEGLLLDGAIAYLLVPGCMTSDPAEQLNFTRRLREVIATLEDSAPRGWILDLRLNGGGNVWPMLLGLQPLLGDGEQAGSIGPEGEYRLGCDRARAWLRAPDGKLIEQLADVPRSLSAPSPGLGPRVRIAVLLGGWTMSSGELIALAFHGKPDTRSFGEATAGLTTATQDFPLRDGSRLNLPISWLSDAAGWAPRGPIHPDAPAPFGAWPTAEDAAARSALAWIRSAH